MLAFPITISVSPAYREKIREYRTLGQVDPTANVRLARTRESYAPRSSRVEHGITGNPKACMRRIQPLW